MGKNVEKVNGLDLWQTIIYFATNDRIFVAEQHPNRDINILLFKKSPISKLPISIPTNFLIYHKNHRSYNLTTQKTGTSAKHKSKTIPSSTLRTSQ